MFDWAALTAIGGAAISLFGVGVSWGVLRNRLATHATRLNEGDKRMDRMEEAITRAANIGNAVGLLSQRVESGHELLTQRQESGAQLLNSKMESVLGEVRSFIQGQASAGLRSTARGQKPE